MYVAVVRAIHICTIHWSSLFICITKYIYKEAIWAWLCSTQLRSALHDTKYEKCIHLFKHLNLWHRLWPNCCLNLSTVLMDSNEEKRKEKTRKERKLSACYFVYVATVCQVDTFTCFSPLSLCQHEPRKSNNFSFLLLQSCTHSDSFWFNPYFDWAVFIIYFLCIEKSSKKAKIDA